MDKLAPAALAVLCLACSVSAQLDGDNYRLPNNSYPVRYDLELTTYVHEDGSARQFRFDGKVKIELVVKDEGNSSITVHYRKTTITHVKLWSTLANGTDRVLLDDNSSFVLDPNREFVTVSTPGVILNGTYFLEFEYYGELREDNAGFYRSSYVDDEGKTRWLATTQFSSTDARHAFPCYDEPGIRTPIGLTVIHGSNYSVLSNNLPKDVGQGPIAGYTRTVFDDTPVMQPYLLGVIVSDFVAVSAVQYPRQGVFARYNAIRNGEGDFILEAGYKILKVLESYLEMDFALPKIYQVAVPDFAAGAMENYGLVTYKEEKFFYDSRSSPMRQKHEIATVVGHEYGHQFFGNMVSPAWWSYLWMKEGFARYFEYLASDMAFPELRIRETYSIQKMQNAFDLDSLGSSRPMTFYVNTQSEIANVFDNIAYDKGGSMMRMFQHAFGPETFRRALINYLRAKAFQGAYPEDFANAIQQSLNNATEVTVPSSITALDILKSWTEKSGYPVITVSRGTDLRVSLIQERYMLKIMDTTEASWIIPYNFATTKNPNFNTTTDTRWLLTNSTILAAEGWSATDWIIFNKQQTGYYRVNYDERLWNLIIEQLMRDPTAIHNMNRAQLVDDVLNFARSGRLGYDTALRLTAYLVRERDYVPWYAANSNLLVLTRLFAGSPKIEYLKKYLLTSINPVFSELGLVTQPSDDLFARQTREIVSMWACAMGSQSCLSKASEILLESVGPSNLQVDPDLRSSIYCAGLVNASEDVFLAVWNRMQTSKDQAFRTDLIYALGCTEKVELKEMFLNTSIANETSGTNYFGQERERVFSSVYRNSRKGTEISLRFFMNNIKKINELYNKGNFGGRAIGSAITGLSKYIVDVELNSLFQDLIEKLSEDNLLRDTDILRALEQSSENLQWIRSKGKDIEDWLELRYPTSTAAPSTTTTTTTTTTEEPTSTTTPERRTTTTLDPPSTTTSTTQSTSTPTAKTTTEEGVTSTTELSTSSPAYDSTTAEPYVETTTKQDGGGAPALKVTLALLMASVTFSFM